MYVSQHMTTAPATVSPDQTILAVRKLLRSHHFRHLPVVDPRGVLLGMVTDRDIRSAYPSLISAGDELQRETERVNVTPVSMIMSTDVVAMQEYATLDDALMLLDTKKVGAIPVVDQDNKVVGIFSVRDLINAYTKLFGLGERGSALVSVLHDGNPRPLTRIVQVLEEHDIHFSRVVRVKNGQPDNGAKEIIYIRVNTFNIHAVHNALENAGFVTKQLVPQKLSHKGGA